MVSIMMMMVMLIVVAIASAKVFIELLAVLHLARLAAVLQHDESHESRSMILDCILDQFWVHDSSINRTNK